MADLITCPKCKRTSGDDWKQCGGFCPMPGSPHFKAAALATSGVGPTIAECRKAALEGDYAVALFGDEVRVMTLIGGGNYQAQDNITFPTQNDAWRYIHHLQRGWA